MPITQEMFRFVTTRRPERVVMSRIASRLIRDRRVTTPNSLLAKLFGARLYETELVTANSFAGSSDFLDVDNTEILALEPAVQFLRDELVDDVVLDDLGTRMEARLPLFAALLRKVPPDALAEAARVVIGRLWDSLYTQTIRGCDRYVTTNYLVDGLRVYHVLALLWTSRKLGLTTWAGGTFDDYEPLIDLKRAMAVESDDPDPDPVPGTHPLPHEYGVLHELTTRSTRLEGARDQIDAIVRSGHVRLVSGPDGEHRFFSDEAVALLSRLPALAKFDVAGTPVDQLSTRVRHDLDVVTLQRTGVLARLNDPDGAQAWRDQVSRLLARPRLDRVAPASISGLATEGGVFRVPLEVGAIKPPAVGDLIVVEQTLNRYELGELADIESIMRGERRERTIRSLARTTQTTTTESSFEQEESSSITTDERFSLQSQAQQTASESFGVETGVSVSGKFGPVQVSASVNASFDTSKSSSASTSQEFARNVTEEASKRVKSSIKETSSFTVLTETQNTSLRGFNNEKGTVHVNGLYRWVDKIYTAQLLNYGRRLMLSLTVPEPAAFYRNLLVQNEAALWADLIEPVHPSRIGRGILSELPDDNVDGGFRSYQDLTEDNYAELAGRYDVVVQPPPAEYLTGSKAFVYPEAMDAAAIKEHDAAGGSNKDDLNYASADNTLTVDPGYRITAVAVFATAGAAGKLEDWADALKLGEDGAELVDANLVLIQVADKSFYLTVYKGKDDKKVITTNFNTYQQIDDNFDAFGERVQAALPITITANFEGVLTFTVLFKAYRLDESFDTWKSQTFAAILKGYAAKRQVYDQGVAIAKSKAQATTESQTFQLRDDQYRSIELTELQRGCIDLLTAGTAAGYTSIAVAADGTPAIVHDAAEGALLGNWRSPLANGSVAEFFQVAFEWENTVYQFHPYFWTGTERWKDLAQASAADPVFQMFLRAGSASVAVSVRPGYERPVILFLKTGLLWGGGKLPLFTSQDMLDVYADVELGLQLDPPEPVGEPWEIRLPTSMVMLQPDDVLPTFPQAPSGDDADSDVVEPEVDETVPFQ